MIQITRHKDRITIQGHAGYAAHGKDIVCAGVSVLVQTLVMAIEELCTDTIQYDMQPGKAEIRFLTLSEGAQLLVKSFFIGAEAIAGEYPDNVRVKNCPGVEDGIKATEKQ